MSRARRPSGLSGAQSGFSLMELLVVVMIMAVLATIGIPGYFKTMEHSKARDAQAMINMVAQAHRTYALDNNDVFISVSAALSSTHTLVSRKYVGANNWTNLHYNYYSCNPGGGGATCCQGTRPVACGTRRNGSGIYANWGYAVSETGVFTRIPSGANAPPAP